MGKVIAGRYRLEARIGEGGMGIVYVGEQQMGSTVRKVAIKTLHQHLSKDSSVLARFHRECGTVAQLEHPNTIKFYDFGATDDGTLYIAMEFVEGKPLSDIIESDGAMPAERVVHIMRQVAGALDEAHEQNIIHRDLKPENIVLGKRAGQTDFVKVLDFGISKQLGEASQRVLTSPSTALGSPQYMAPEQMEGVHVDVRADIWALGAILYEMVCGAKAFTGETLAQVCVQVMSGSFKPIRELAPEVPADLAVAIEQCLQLEKTERFDNMSAFANALMPYGSERARTSATRIARVLGLRPPHDDRISSDRTSSLGGSASGDVDPMRRTEAATPVAREASAALPASSHTVEVNRSSSRWPISSPDRTSMGDRTVPSSATRTSTATRARR